MGAFTMGCFSPSQTNSSTRYYIGIWYSNVVPKSEIVWVANRDNPIIPSSAVKLAVTNNRSGMVLSDPDEGRIYWSTENNITATGGGGAGGVNASAVLLNDGNLVLRSSNGTVLCGRASITRLTRSFRVCSCG